MTRGKYTRTKETKLKMSNTRKKMYANGIIPLMKGKKFSEEHKKNISKSHKGLLSGEKHPLFGKHHSEETKQKIRMNNHLGKKASEETKLKMSESHKGRKAWNKGLKHSEETKKKIRESTKQFFINHPEIKPLISHKLENNPRWLGGISFEPYNKTFNRKFKREIRKRDNHICLKCGIHQERLSRVLDVHHINYNKLLSIKENCCSLCHSCNAEVNSNRTSWMKFFQSLLSERYGYKYSENGDIILELNGGLK